ncbi:MAG: IS630 family transposase [Gammaproteobacteria bacterium]
MEPAPACGCPQRSKTRCSKHAPTRKSVACFGAVSLRSGTLVTELVSPFDAVTFGNFLTKLLKHRAKGKRMVIIMDNAKYHHAKLLAPLLHKQRNVLTLLFLPPYSPELNPIERVWKLTKRFATHNQYFATLDEIILSVSERFRLWACPNHTLVRLCGIS